MKLKRSVTIPSILIIYLAGIAYYAWPERNPNVSWLQFGMTLGVSLLCVIILFFVLKKRDQYRGQDKQQLKK